MRKEASIEQWKILYEAVIPPASSFLPFLSIGRSNILLCYALVGIIMSIYRYKDVYPKKMRVSQVSFQKKFTINI